MDDYISRQAAIDAVHRACNYFDICDYKGVGCKQIYALKTMPSAERPSMAIEALSGQTEIIYCKECVYYDPPHIEDKGKRLEYKDMPKDAFDELGTWLVHSGYGINVGGRCLRDYNVGYSEDKRVYVSEDNYCGRAERR